jgi:hypothetical protein
MTSTSENPAGSSDANSVHGTPAASGHFMLTLCRLAAPVSIRPPESPHLKPYTFFTSSARQPDGSERLYLHMGYFQTLNDAERCLELVRGRYPDAIATIAPGPFLQVRQGAHLASLAASLSDTQVLKILEKRRAAAAPDGVGESNGEQIEMLRPEDTATRQALKEAVVQGAPVSFALQLKWSTEPIDLSRVPSLPIFKGHTLYVTESRREGRSRYFLRLGFFADPISPRQIAVELLAKFASAAVVPVSEQEVTLAREEGKGGSLIPYLLQQRADPPPDFDGFSAALAAPAPAKPSSDGQRRTPRGPATLEQTLRQLARREMLTDPDSVNASGVRHLRVEVLESTSRRLLKRFGGG